ncbi:hypothetical protein Btru_021648 [Bulinus truncatus]|nr:hypothetical protein Btru_021648 [Bulinus truncatus]
MSFFSGGKVRDKDPAGPKSQFYVEFLGWMECRGVRGAHHTDPVIRELKQRQKKMIKPPKLTVQVSRSDLKITQEVDEPKKKGIKKIKFPTIPARDITYVRQGRHSDGRLDDVVACIFLGYMPRTQRYVHVHVYRFDEAATATTFAKQLSSIVEANYEHILEVEEDLIRKGEVDDVRIHSPGADTMGDDSALGSASSAFSDDEPPTFNSDDIDPDLQSLKDVMPFDNVAEELKFRLQMGDGPLLLPPKDYDTIRRGHGNLEKVKERRCLNLQIIGQNAVVEEDNAKERLGSNESGVDMASPGSESTVKTDHQQNTFDSSTSPGISPSQGRRSLKESNSSNGSFNSQLKPDLNSKSSLHSGSASPGSPPLSAKDFVYPPKERNPPTSPPLYRSQLSKEKVVKQASLNSYLNDVSKMSSHAQDHEYREDKKPVHYYPNSDTEDIYAMPVKNSSSKYNLPPEDEIPPDYDDDLEFNNRVNNLHSKNGNVSKISKADPRYRQPPPLRRNLSEDHAQNEKIIPNSGRPADIRRKEANPYAGQNPHHPPPPSDKAHGYKKVAPYSIMRTV